MLAYTQHQILVRLAELFADYTGHDIEETIASHRATLEAIESRDAVRIRSVMAEHLGLLERAQPSVRSRRGAGRRGASTD